MSLEVETLRTKEAMAALQEGWEDLHRGDATRSPFLSPDWFRCCLEDAQGSELFLIAVREGTRLVGIAPLSRYRLPVRWRNARAIGFIRCRETPYADFIVEDGRREAIVGAILQHLHSTERSSWDLLDLGPWPHSSPNVELGRKWLGAWGAKWTESTASLVPVVTMPEGWDAFMESRSYLFRKSRRGVLNRMGRLGNTQVECHRSDPDGEVLRAICDVSSRSWKHDDGKALTSRAESMRFFAALTQAAGRRGSLLVWILRLNGSPIAMEYNLTENGIVYALRADYDQTYRQSSPGAFLEYHIFQRLFSEGCRAYHAGPGSDAYKLRWTEELSRNIMVTVFNRGAANQALWLTETWAIPKLRRLRDRLVPTDRAGRDQIAEEGTS
jgi:CelD/BcsL family acetyltransferase involved in cellulose biosynthesis